MTDSVLLVQRNTPSEGSLTQSADVLANHGSDYYLWSVGGITVSDTDTQVQTYLNSQVSVVITAILANNETPLTAEQLSNYQNIIDLQQTQQWLDTLKTDLDLIQSATGIPNASLGLKQAFSDGNKTVYDALTNANRNELIRATINQTLGTQADEIRALRILLKRAKRIGASGFSSASLKI
jgi:hypothetical protein